MIDNELARFLEGGVSIHLGVRNERLEPDGTRVTAVKVEPDGLHLIAYVPTAGSARVLPQLEANGQAALVFGRPTDDHAYQVKGVFAGTAAVGADDEPFIRAQWERFEDQLERIGLRRALYQQWVTWPCVAVRVRATAVFCQTPGPNAGASVA